jgi:SHS2 domain-containing protein
VTNNQAFEEIEHTADWALRIRGRTWPEFLVNAAQGMTSLMLAEPTAIPLAVERSITLEAIDAESLLVNWLSELAYWAEAEKLLFAEFQLTQISLTFLQAKVVGGPVAQLQKHIKAVTYHNLEIGQGPAGFEATVVFDV